MRAMGTAARYDAYASWYDARLGLMTREIAVPILQAWLGPGPGVCLDLGCGGGVHLAAVAALGWSVIGLDVSWRQLRIARERSSARVPVASDAAPMQPDASRGQAEAAAVPINAPLRPTDAPPRQSDATQTSVEAMPTPAEAMPMTADVALLPAGTTPAATRLRHPSAEAAQPPAEAAPPLAATPQTHTSTDAAQTRADAVLTPADAALTPAEAALLPAATEPTQTAAVLGRAGATLLEGGAAVTDEAGATTPVPSRTVALVQADAARLPLADATVDAVVTAFIHSDVDDWAGVLAEVGRVLRPGGRCISIGIHPCFVGPFSRRTGDEPPRLYPGYRRTARTWRGPGLSPHGVWWRVGGQHVPLAALVNAFIQAGLTVEHLAEPGPEDFPRNLAIVARRPQAPRR